MAKILSIIIPTYNMEALLDKCLTSLILDTKELREKLDVIIVNDGSSDNSSEIAHRYAEKYPEMFSVIDKENGNYGSCINAALPKVKGKYVRILDADDSYFTEELADYFNLLNQLDVELVLSNYETINPDGNVIAKSGYPLEPNIVSAFSEVPAGLFIAMHSVAYLSEIFKRIKYHQTEGVSYTDLEWVFHPMSQVKTIFYYNRVIYKYLIGREGQTVDPTVRLKRLSDMEKGLWNQLKIFKYVPKSNMAYNYMHGVITYRTKLLYTWGLDRKAAYHLDAFDKKLRQKAPAIYEEATQYTIPLGIANIEMPIVKMWRRVKKRNLLYIFPLFDLHVIINRIKRFWT